MNDSLKKTPEGDTNLFISETLIQALDKDHLLSIHLLSINQTVTCLVIPGYRTLTSNELRCVADEIDRRNNVKKIDLFVGGKYKIKDGSMVTLVKIVEIFKETGHAIAFVSDRDILFGSPDGESLSGCDNDIISQVT